MRFDFPQGVSQRCHRSALAVGLGVAAALVSQSCNQSPAWGRWVPNVGSYEPAGFVPVAAHRFSCAPASGECDALGTWTVEPGGLINFSIALDSNAPHSPDSVGATRFPAGHVAGTGPVWFDGWGGGGYATAFYDKIYLSMWVRIVGPDYENQAVGTKLGFIAYGEDPRGAANQGFFMLIGNGVQDVDTAFHLGFWQQNHVSRSLSQPDTAPKVMTVGSWHRWEVLLALNTPNQSDGVLRWWVDGRLILSHDDIVYVMPGAMFGFYNYRWNPTWGGQGGVKTRDDVIQIDEIYISGVPTTTGESLVSKAAVQ